MPLPQQRQRHLLRLGKKIGKQHHRSLRTTDRQFAERQLHDYKIKITRLVTPTKNPNITFKELAEDWFAMAKLAQAKGLQL